MSLKIIMKTEKALPTTRRFAASGAITRIKGNAKRVNLSLVARELIAPPDGKPRNTLGDTRTATPQKTIGLQ
jgi:hypothetical protein